MRIRALHSGLAVAIAVTVVCSAVVASPALDAGTVRYIAIIREHVGRDYEGMFREEGGAFRHPFLAPGSAQYGDVLWDWDSWLSDVALRQVLLERGDDAARRKALRYEEGCVLNYLNYGGMDGWVPILLKRQSPPRQTLLTAFDSYATNMHKPCLAQHAAFIVKLNGGDAEWLRENFYPLQAFVNRYKNHQRHSATGLYFWNGDAAIGVDNDPATFMCPAKSSGSIYLNCMMYKELLALVYLCDRLSLAEIGAEYRRDADELKTAIQKHCWDERDGYFYSVDLNLLPYEGKPFAGDPQLRLHAGYPRDYDCLIQRLGVWSGFLAMWAGIATPEQVSGWWRSISKTSKPSTRPTACAHSRRWKRCTTCALPETPRSGPDRSGAYRTISCGAGSSITATTPRRRNSRGKPCACSAAISSAAARCTSTICPKAASRCSTKDFRTGISSC
jgi:putative isomerase